MFLECGLTVDSLRMCTWLVDSVDMRPGMGRVRGRKRGGQRVREREQRAVSHLVFSVTMYHTCM